MMMMMIIIIIIIIIIINNNIIDKCVTSPVYFVYYLVQINYCHVVSTITGSCVAHKKMEEAHFHIPIVCICQL